MAHQSHIKIEKYRQWVKVGLGLGYLKEGLAPFCDDVAKQQHKYIIDNIQQTHTIQTEKCDTCALKTLQPDHVNNGKNQCPLHHANCNCCCKLSKTPCPNNVCGAIYDSIITNHASTPPAPNWKNTQTQQWTTDPWSIAKCFINAPGYEKKTSAADTDCSGLLHVIINNKYFHNHVSCNIINVLSKVRQYRNEILYSSTMEIDSTKTNSYIDDMIVVLQDRIELFHRQDAKDAVKKLLHLQKEAFILTTEDVEKVLGDIREDLTLIKGTTFGLAKDNDDQKEKINNLESKTSKLQECIKDIEYLDRKRTEYDSSKADLRQTLIEEYRKNVLKVSAMPCHPGDSCDFENVYVLPKLRFKLAHKLVFNTTMKTMSDILVINDKPVKSIYILGEAGSGKSSYCKYLVQCWCMAHSDTKNLVGPTVEEKTGNYVDSFLFFLPLRHCTDKKSINDMIKEKYDHPVLKELLKRESETCLIVLDGLDEWTNGETCPPKRAEFCNYTVLTTSRPWKIVSLGISEHEMRQIYIEIYKLNMIENTLHILQEKFPERKRAKNKDDPQECKKWLLEKPSYHLTDNAMMFQQLICLWSEARPHATSKCHLYTGMLDLYFMRYRQTFPNLFEKIFTKSKELKLPGYFDKTEECTSFSYIIRNVSKLAHQTLIQNKLTFESSMFEELDILDDVKDCCLKIGILSQQECPSLSTRKSKKSHLSFIHKSVQEYLAAVHIVTEQKLSYGKTMQGQYDDDPSKMLNVQTLDELLEQEICLIMLCGLQPSLAKYISKLIYNIVARNAHVIKHRAAVITGLHGFNRYSLLIKNIQNLILNCIEETKASTSNKFSFDLGDLIIRDGKDTNRLIAGIDEQNISLDSTVSFQHDRFQLEGGSFDEAKIFRCMTKCKKLESLCIRSGFNQPVCDSINANASTLKFLFVANLEALTPEPRKIFDQFAKITHLVALQVEGRTVAHEDFIALCTFLSGPNHLQQISIRIKCDCEGQHNVNLSTNEQLEYLEYYKSLAVTKVNWPNLEDIKCNSLTISNCKNVLNLLKKSMKLKNINLVIYDPTSDRDSEEIRRELKSVTTNLIALLPLLQQLQELTLKSFIFTDNIIKNPLEIRSIEFIDISIGKMSLLTWQKFVNSVADIPQPVSVEADAMCITQDEEEYNPKKTYLTGGGKEADALQFVKTHKALFDVSYANDETASIKFSKKK